MASLEEIGSQAYQEELKRQAEAQLAPTRDLGYQALDLNLQDIGQQEANVTRQAENLAQTLREQAVRSTKGMEERFNELGLLQSGLTAAGLGDIQKTLGKGLTESEQDKAASLANLALQRAGIGIKRQQVQQQYLTDVNSLVNQLIETARQAEIQRLSDIAAAKKASSGTSNPFAGLFNTAQPQTAQAKPLDQYFKELFDAGQYVQGTEDYADALSRASHLDSGEANPYYGMTKDQILAVAYNVRKPYESSVSPQIMAKVPSTGYVSPTKLFGLKG